jgi:hypothetical protein
MVLFGHVAQRAARARHAGHAGFLHDIDGRHLVAHHADHVGARADERKPLFSTRPQSLRSRTGSQNRVDATASVTSAALMMAGMLRQFLVRLAADAHDRRPANMLEVVVGRGMHGDRLDAELAQARRIVARSRSVGDDFVEHLGYSMTNNGCPNSTGSLLVAGSRDLAGFVARSGSSSSLR